ncbi:PmeII family type II restriction endonuclease [Maribacter sp. 2304DJ31-5]|uniref:PmeII family type II restriction endonuclease n=1 Tax=Maribacter sp. 2304DJ31-5 TaxID=3386273 RepID=UPI0039BD46CB
MNKLNLEDVKIYVEENIGIFHQKRIDKLDDLKLKDILKRKNPYLFRAKNVLIASDIVQGILDAWVSSSEEGIFGDWLEGLAIFVNNKVYGGWKSGGDGIDLEFDKEGARHIVTIKSGPNWFNDSSWKKMIDNFDSARRRLKTSGSGINVVAVNGCCYGRSTKRFEYKKKGDLYKYCGQSFWTYISNDDNLYKDLIIPIGYKAKEKNEEFLVSYSKILNKFTLEFSESFCLENGAIDWDKLVEFNSSIR